MHRYLKIGYLIIICTILPLYMQKGYFELGEAKGRCYLLISAVFALLFLLVDNKRLFKGGRLPGYMAYALSVFLFSGLISFAFSVDKKVGFFGLEGWRTGLLSTLLAVFFFYVFYEKDNLQNRYLLAALGIVPFLECLLSILHRFGVYPFYIYGKAPGFLATIGNINWFTAFLSVFVPLGVGISFCQKLFSKEFFLSSAFVFVSLMALFLQGSDSAFLVLAGTYLVLLFASLSSREEFRRFLVQLFLAGLVMEACSLLILFTGEAYTYQNNLLKQACLMHVGAIIMAVVLLIYRSSRLFEEIKVPWKPVVYRIAAGVLAAAGAVVLAIMVFKNLDYDSGNGRVIIYSICLDMFRDMDPVRKLFGTGQDCLSVYAYADPATSESLFNVFDFNTLTNAHCDLLTILIERGFLGLAAYLALISSFARGIFMHKNKHAAIICALILSSYLLNSLVSFSLVVSMPYFLLAMSILLSAEKS